MKITTIALIIIATMGLTQAADNAWLAPSPRGWLDRADTVEVDDAILLEVVHSKVNHALAMLSSKSAVPLTDSEVTFLTGHRRRYLFKRPSFVLVRAQFGHGSTGAYSISKSADGKQLVISHLSLGGPTSPTRSALVLRLKTVPEHVFADGSFAK